MKVYCSRGDWMTTAYVHLDTCAMPRPPELHNNTEPCTDLLQCWKEALEIHDTSWEVRWTPLTHGKDKRMWIRFPQLKVDPEDPGFQEKCKTHLLAWAKTKGYPVTSSYVNPGGVTLCLASPGDVDVILSCGVTDKILGIPIPVLPARGRQVEIENVFELAITGLSDDYDLDHLHDMLRDWLEDNFELDGVTTLASTRTVMSEPEFFIFHMTTWKATCDVLSDDAHGRFEEY